MTHCLKYETFIVTIEAVILSFPNVTLKHIADVTKTFFQNVSNRIKESNKGENQEEIVNEEVDNQQAGIIEMDSVAVVKESEIIHV